MKTLVVGSKTSFRCFYRVVSLILKAFTANFRAILVKHSNKDSCRQRKCFIATLE